MEARTAYCVAAPGKWWQQEAIGAIRDGFMEHGVIGARSVDDADVYVSWGKDRPPPNGTPWLILEAGYINGRSGDYTRDRLRFISTSWNDLHGCASPAPSGRPPDRWESLGVEMAPWQTWDRGGWPMRRLNALIAMQHPGDRMAPPPGRMMTVAEQYDQMGWEYRVREHPLIAHEPPLSEQLFWADVVVTYSSTLAVESVLAGVPTVALSDRSIACPVTSRHPQDSLFIGDRSQWAYDLAYRQWTLDELRDGTAWEFVKHGTDPDN